MMTNTLFIKTMIVATLTWLVMTTASAAPTETTLRLEYKILRKALNLEGERGVRVPQTFVFNGDDQLVFIGKIGSLQSDEEIMEALTDRTKPRLSAPISAMVAEALKSTTAGIPTLVYLTLSKEAGSCSACEPYLPNLLASVHNNQIAFNALRIEITPGAK